MSHLYYVFNDQQTAIDAENYITNIGGAPILSVKAVTKEIDENATPTVRWAIPWQRVTDGKWVFKYVGDETIAQYPESVTNYFETNFPNTREEFSEDWLPEESLEDEDE